MNPESKKGFTLIELLVVIAIIGILASVVLASLSTARAKARDASRAQNIKEIQKALELYYHDNGQYPNIWAGSVSSVPDLNTALASYIGTLSTDATYPTSIRYRTGGTSTTRNTGGYTILIQMEKLEGLNAPAGPWCRINRGNGVSTNGYQTYNDCVF